MPKFSPTPRLSIIVPVGSDIPAFENTLISVLENRPQHCEVIVAHDGNYDDPFMLADEVEFHIASSTRLCQIVAEAARASRGHITHVLADGIIATEGWIEPALEQFERHDTAIVAPVVRDTDSGNIINAGWVDSAVRLCHSLATGHQDVRRRDVNRIDGAYLQASFWRRDVLARIDETLSTPSTIEAVYAHTLVTQLAGWHVAMAPQSSVYCDHTPNDWTASSFSRGQRLRAIHDVVDGESHGISSAIKSLVRNALRPSLYAESLGQAASSFSSSKIEQRLNVETVGLAEDAVPEPLATETSAVESYRRAA